MNSIENGSRSILLFGFSYSKHEQPLWERAVNDDIRPRSGSIPAGVPFLVRSRV